MRIRCGWVAAALAAAPALAAAQICPSLSSIDLPGGSWRIEQPLVQALHEVLTPHGWSLQLRDAPAGFVGPRISGQVAAPTLLQALQHATQAARAAGWRVDLMADKGRCQAVLAFDAQQAAVGSSAASAAPASSTSGGAAPAARLQLRAGVRLGQQMQQWAQSRGWRLTWDVGVDWLVPADIDMDGGDVLATLDKLAAWLTQEGKPIQFVAYEGNRVVQARALVADVRAQQ